MDWQESAACRTISVEDRDVRFFPEGKHAQAVAQQTIRQFCRTCPVIASCAAYGQGEKFGVWGGVFRAQHAVAHENRRKRIARGRIADGLGPWGSRTA